MATAYICFCKDNREKIKDRNPGMSGRKLYYELCRIWTELPYEEKKLYIAEQAENMAVYEREKLNCPICKGKGELPSLASSEDYRINNFSGHKEFDNMNKTKPCECYKKQESLSEEFYNLPKKVLEDLSQVEIELEKDDWSEACYPCCFYIVCLNKTWKLVPNEYLEELSMKLLGLPDNVEKEVRKYPIVFTEGTEDFMEYEKSYEELLEESVDSEYYSDFTEHHRDAIRALKIEKLRIIVRQEIHNAYTELEKVFLD